MVVECLLLSNNIYENYGLSKSVNIDVASLKIKNAFFFERNMHSDRDETYYYAPIYPRLL